MRFLAPLALMLVLAVGACSGLSADAMALLKEKSAEIGAKDVVMFDTRKRAVDGLIAMCLDLKLATPIEQRIDCVKGALKLME